MQAFVHAYNNGRMDTRYKHMEKRCLLIVAPAKLPTQLFSYSNWDGETDDLAEQLFHFMK